MTQKRFDPPAHSRSRSASVTDRLRQADIARNKSLEAHRQAAAERAEKERAEIERKNAIPVRDVNAQLKALGEIPLFQLDRTEKLHASAAYTRLADAALRTMNGASREAVLCWPNGNLSPAAVVAMLALADCGAAAPVAHNGTDALAAPMGLRALIYPYARTIRHALRYVYVGKDYIAPLQLKHQVRCFDLKEDQAFGDYHKVLARVKQLTGKAVDGKKYAEFENPSLEEVVPFGPCQGKEGRSNLLARISTKTDLPQISRTGLADDPAKARFYLFGLRENENIEQGLRHVGRIDVVFLDLTAKGRQRLQRNWVAQIRTFLAALESRLGPMAVVALTDDPWSFDKLRFDALLKEPRRRRGGTPASSSVIFTQTADIAVASDVTPAPYAAVKHQEVMSFGGDTEETMRTLRAARHAALELNDANSAESLGKLMSVVGRCASLPASRPLLSEYIEHEHEQGANAAAEMMAVYRAGTVIRNLQEAHGAWAQTSRPALLDVCARVQKLIENTEQRSPMASLLRDVLSKYLRNSSRTAVLFQKDMLADFAEYALAKDPDIGEFVRARLDKGMLLFVDRAGLADLDNLGESQRNYIKNLIVVGPTRADLMALLARSWLPDNLTILADADMLANAVRDASRLAQYPELGALKSRLGDFAVSASEEVRRVTNSAVDLEAEAEPSESVNLPLSGVVNLAGKYQADQQLIHLKLEGGQAIIARPKTKLVIQDQSHVVTVFKEEEARFVDEGDSVCVIGEAFLEMARPLLNITAHAAEEIRDYHELVLKRFAALPGKSTTERLAVLVQKMAVAGVTPARAHYWINLEDQLKVPLHEVIPHAPRDLPTFLPFMAALQVGEAVARRYWTWAVIAQRTSRKRAALTFHDAYRSILVDTYSAQSDNPQRARDVRRLRAAAENFVSKVQSKQEQRGDHARA